MDDNNVIKNVFKDFKAKIYFFFVDKATSQNTQKLHAPDAKTFLL